MTIDLVSINGESINLSRMGWNKIFDLAVNNGWEPMGTIRPSSWPEDEWCSDDYFSNAGQLVQSGDALELADALVRVIPNLPEKREDIQPLEFKSNAELYEALDDPKKREKLREYLRAIYIIHKGWESKLRELISLCRSGEFIIL